jgi:hypothetical protein
MTPAITLPPFPDPFVSERLETANFPLDAAKRFEAEVGRLGDSIEQYYDRVCEVADAGDDAVPRPSEAIRKLWDLLCDEVLTNQRWLASASFWPRGAARTIVVNASVRHGDRLTALMRTIAVVWDELELTTPDDIFEDVWTVRISPLAYIRAMWNLFWSAIRHPLSETTIELHTGRVLAAE